MVDSALIKSQKLEKLQQLQQQHLFSNYRLKWRQSHLFVSLKKCAQSSLQPTIESEQWLVECLKHSSARLVRLDPNLGEDRIDLWATACFEAKMPVFIHRLPFACKMKSSSPRLQLIYRFIDLIAAALLLLALSPVILILVSIIRLDSPEPLLLWQLGVSQQGKLFRVFKFRTKGGIADNPRIPYLWHWMCKYILNELPQLLNVLRGEISLIGPRSCSLSLLLKNKL